MPERAPRMRERLALLEAEYGPDACWPWPSFRDKDGYGKTTRGKGAHRRAYEVAVGPIPDGHDVHHRCLNTACVNPRHLRTALKVAHMRIHWPAPEKQWAPGKRTRSLATHCRRGHELVGETVRIEARRRRCRECDRLHHRKKVG